MLNATITGEIVTFMQLDPTGAKFCTINSPEARRSVRVYFRNEQQAALVEQLPKHGRLTVSGRLIARGGISETGKASALLSIYAQQLKIHEARP